MKLALLGLLALLIIPGSAFAAEGSNGKLGSTGEMVVGVTVSEPGGSSPQDVASTSSEPLIHYESFPSDLDPGSLAGLCSADHGDVIVAGVPVGVWYRVVGRDSTGAIVSDQPVCVPLVALGSTEPPPPPALPVAPTVAEVWRAVQLPAPDLHVDPDSRGVTGLETRISTGGPTTVTVSAGIRGYEVRGVATLVGHHFDTDEGPLAGDGDARHTFERKGGHEISVSATWQATVTLTGPGITTPIPVAIGTATIRATRSYPVVEIRGVLLP